MLLAPCFSAQAQQPTKIPRIGFLSEHHVREPHIESHRRGLQALGYTEGKDILIEYRYYETMWTVFRP